MRNLNRLQLDFLYTGDLGICFVTIIEINFCLNEIPTIASIFLQNK